MSSLRYVQGPVQTRNAGMLRNSVSGIRATYETDPEVIAAARAAKGITPRSFPADEIVTRLLRAMAEEGEALLAEGIAARASDIDLVMINGYGFPAHKGGPMFIAADGSR